MVIHQLSLGLLLAAQQPTVVVIDSGHDPYEPGAMGTRGVPELVFNDRLAAEVVDRLALDPQIDARLSRSPTELLALGARVRRIRAMGAQWLISIHHDSVKPQFLSWRDEDGIQIPTCTAYQGYSLFAQSRGPGAERSAALAAAISDRYQALGLSRTRYHAMNIRGERRRWIDEARGIHAGDHLYLLRKLAIPVVLVESGFVVNPEDERRLADPAHVAELAEAIAAGIVDTIAAAALASSPSRVETRPQLATHPPQ